MYFLSKIRGVFSRPKNKFHMNRRFNRKTGYWRSITLLIAVFCLVCTLKPVSGAIVSIVFDIQTFFQSDGSSGLPIGSTLFLIASESDTPSTPQSFGDALIANSISSDEVLIATSFLNGAPGFNDGSPVPGEHFEEIPERPASLFDGMNFLYVRFFDYQQGASVVGTDISWGTSTVLDLSASHDSGAPVFDREIDLLLAFFDDATATNQNNFVVIPEPGTFSLIALAGLGLAALNRRNSQAKLIVKSSSLSQTKL